MYDFSILNYANFSFQIYFFLHKSLCEFGTGHPTKRKVWPLDSKSIYKGFMRLPIKGGSHIDNENQTHVLIRYKLVPYQLCQLLWASFQI